MRISLPILILGTMLLVYGCALSLRPKVYIEQSLETIDCDKARISVERQSRAAQSAGHLYILDDLEYLQVADTNGQLQLPKGEPSGERNVIYFQVEDKVLINLRELGCLPLDLSQKREVFLLFLRTSSKDFIIGDPAKAECEETVEFDIKLGDMKPKYVTVTYPGVYLGPHGEPITAIGAIGAGDSMTWDRKPGHLRLRAVFGWNNTTHSIDVESGKHYFLYWSGVVRTHGLEGSVAVRDVQSLPGCANTGSNLATGHITKNVS